MRDRVDTLLALLDIPSDHALVVYPCGKISYVNETFLKASGLPREQVIGRNLTEVLPSPLGQKRLETIQQVAQTGQPVRFVDEGVVGWLDSMVYPIKDSRGRVKYIAVLARDITETKKIERALRRSQKLQRRLLDELEQSRSELARRVEVRTAELEASNRELRAEAEQRQLVEAELRRTAQRAVALARIATQLNAPLQLRDVVQTMCDEALLVCSYPTASVHLYDEEKDRLWIAAASGKYGQKLMRLKPEAGTFYEQVLDEAGPYLIIPDAERYSFPGDTILSAEIQNRTVIILPLVHGGETIGALTLYSHTGPRQPEDEELTLLEGLAQVGSSAVAKAMLFHQVRESRARLQSLSQRLVETQESERRKLAVELHDEVGQMLTSLGISLERIGGAFQQADHRETRWAEQEIGTARQQVRAILEQVRQLSLTLRPPMLDELGLLPALVNYVNKFSEQNQAQIDFRHSGLDNRFEPAVENAVYRMVQEGLTNFIRHANAREVSVRILYDDGLLVAQVSDQGAGFDPQEALKNRASTGLPGMRERIELCGGLLTIEAGLGEGVCLTAEFQIQPLKAEVGGSLK